MAHRHAETRLSIDVHAIYSTQELGAHMPHKLRIVAAQYSRLSFIVKYFYVKYMAIVMAIYFT